MSEELGMEMLRQALERAKEKGRADDTDQQKHLRLFLDDLHDVCSKYNQSVGSELMMKSIASYLGLALNKSLGPAFAAILALDLSRDILEAAIGKDI